MPCYTVQTMSVEFKADHLELLVKALKSLQIDYHINKSNDNIFVIVGSMVIDLGAEKAEIPKDMQSKLNAIKRAYSMECLKHVAQKNRWQITKKTGTKGSFTKAY